MGMSEKEEGQSPSGFAGSNLTSNNLNQYSKHSPRHADGLLLISSSSWKRHMQLPQTRSTYASLIHSAARKMNHRTHPIHTQR